MSVFIRLYDYTINHNKDENEKQITQIGRKQTMSRHGHKYCKCKVSQYDDAVM